MKRWSHVNAIYQIYPRSFKDTNGDGVGDLAGIIDKLEYLKGHDDSLGVDAIWLTPFYPSPMADFGYDVSDYRSIDPLFGTLDDFDRLIKEAHARNIKVMIDFVPNHTSDEHEWFMQSRSDTMNDRRHWYTWRDPAPDGGPPNNWLSVFGGSAWEFDEATNQYYLHSFLSKQPDLNWANPSVRRAMMSVLIFWLERGIDGFRVDAIRWLSKDSAFQDNPLNPHFEKGGQSDKYNSQIQLNSQYGPELFEYLREIASTVEEYSDAIVVFEDYPDVGRDHISQYMNLYKDVNPEVAAPLNYDGVRAHYDAGQLRDFVTQFQDALEANYRPFYAFGNHDKSRLATRVGREHARLIAMLHLTLPGLPIVYYGDELGMQDGLIEPSEVRDPFEKSQPGIGLGRDPQRTPMQWSAEYHAGFSEADPWLPIASDSASWNVATETSDIGSFLSLYRHLLRLRSVSPLLREGSFTVLDAANDRVFMYVREYAGEKMTIVLNVSDQPCSVNVGNSRLVFLSSSPDRRIGRLDGPTIELAAHEALIVR